MPDYVPEDDLPDEHKYVPADDLPDELQAKEPDNSSPDTSEDTPTPGGELVNRAFMGLSPMTVTNYLKNSSEGALREAGRMGGTIGDLVGIPGAGEFADKQKDWLNEHPGSGVGAIAPQAALGAAAMLAGPTAGISGLLANVGRGALQSYLTTQGDQGERLGAAGNSAAFTGGLGVLLVD